MTADMRTTEIQLQQVASSCSNAFDAMKDFPAAVPVDGESSATALQH